MRWNLGATICALVAGCAPTTSVSGGAMLNVQPRAQPVVVGALDFDLLGAVRGQACVLRKSKSGTSVEYWIGTLPFDGTPPKDSLTMGAIAAASMDAIERIKGADTLMVTRVIAEGRSPDEVCAYVYGRAVRLKKAAPDSDHAAGDNGARDDIRDEPEQDDATDDEEDADDADGRGGNP